jgi:TRAP-type C4-dicarboxylate transport system permease large subunit/TRAP-type C4-dicarboxylate transport system permease small subunit
VADKFSRVIHLIEDSLAYFSLFLLALFPFLEVIAREFFHTGVPNSTVYLQHLVLVATFIAGAITSRQKRHLSLAVGIPIKEPVKEIVHTAVNVLCAAMTLAFAWSSLSFALRGFEPMQKIGIFPLRLIALVMFLGYLAMGVRFIIGMDYKKRRGLWLLLAAFFGSVLAFTSVIQVFAALSASPPAFLTSLEKLFQAGVAQSASPLIILLIVSAFFGSPIFVVLGGIGYLLFAHKALPLEVVPNQAYAMLTGYSIAAIPLFTLTGFLLSESKAGERLIRLFRAFFSWFPGGLAVVAILVCAFFTTFTGASGVTIVALGGLLYYVLVNGGYGKVFTVGLLTASGSIGLLFPPSLPVIIYGVTSQLNIKEMFKGGILPGVAMVLSVVALGIIYAIKSGVERHPFNLKETLSAIRESIWEILLPIIIFIGYFGVPASLVKRLAIALTYVLAVEALLPRDSRTRKLPNILMTYIPVSAVFIALFCLPTVSWLGIGIIAAVSAIYGFMVVHFSHQRLDSREFSAVFIRFLLLVAGVLAVLAAAASVSLTIVESAAIAVIYAFIVELLIYRDLKIKDLPKILGKSLPIIGGVLTILALANGLSYYIIDAEIPMKLTAWVQAAVSSKYIFLLILNLALLVVGCFLDIYSAILVVVPLIIPLGDLFHIHPVHLGVIFLANLELGYLTPPVGLNLYLASYRFDEPVVKIYKDVQVFLLLRLATVLLITYIPFLTTALLQK